MLPRLGSKYAVEIEVIHKPKAEYHTEEYYALEMPVAPAIMVGDEIVTEGADIAEDMVETAIRRHLGME
jgi:hypothetical protein